MLEGGVAVWLSETAKETGAEKPVAECGPRVSHAHEQVPELCWMTDLQASKTPCLVGSGAGQVIYTGTDSAGGCVVTPVHIPPCADFHERLGFSLVLGNQQGRIHWKRLFQRD